MGGVVMELKDYTTEELRAELKKRNAEERAILNLEYERDFLGNDLSENMVRRAYIRGATEQKIIDTEWLRSQMKTLYGDEWYNPNIEYWVNEFRKATK